MKQRHVLSAIEETDRFVARWKALQKSTFRRPRAENRQKQAFRSRWAAERSPEPPGKQLRWVKEGTENTLDMVCRASRSRRREKREQRRVRSY